MICYLCGKKQKNKKRKKCIGNIRFASCDHCNRKMLCVPNSDWVDKEQTK